MNSKLHKCYQVIVYDFPQGYFHDRRPPDCGEQANLRSCSFSDIDDAIELVENFKEKSVKSSIVEEWRLINE